MDFVAAGVFGGLAAATSSSKSADVRSSPAAGEPAGRQTWPMDTALSRFWPPYQRLTKPRENITDENIAKGFASVGYGFAAIALFMCGYYLLFGVFSTLALALNLLLLVAVLSMLQATLTLPGIAAIALTLGMAIDSNVLINERVREELRGGASPQAAIHKIGRAHV